MSDSSPLAKKVCVPCRGGVPPLPAEQAQGLLAQLADGWRLVDGHHVERTFAFSNFVKALDFTNRVGALAEENDHHPDIHLSWGKVRVEIWTHKIDGLTESDFVLAAKIDQLCSS